MWHKERIHIILFFTVVLMSTEFSISNMRPKSRQLNQTTVETIAAAGSFALDQQLVCMDDNDNCVTRWESRERVLDHIQSQSQKIGQHSDGRGARACYKTQEGSLALVIAGLDFIIRACLNLDNGQSSQLSRKVQTRMHGVVIREISVHFIVEHLNCKTLDLLNT